MRLKLIIIFTLFCFSKLHAQSVPSNIFKNADYKNAVVWLKDHPAVDDSLISYGIPVDEAMAIVFPELMRYSALEDKMEVTGLMVLYTRMGKEYADFSVGHFQMKPSFVEQLETDARKYLPAGEVHRIYPFLLHGEDTQDTRRLRVGSLTSIGNEVRYLALFYKICLRRFKLLQHEKKSDRIAFMATAYNAGYQHSMKYLEAKMGKRQFPIYTGLSIKQVNYAVLALTWWKSADDNQMIVK